MHIRPKVSADTQKDKQPSTDVKHSTGVPLNDRTSQLTKLLQRLREELQDPITLQLINKPRVASDGHAYDEAPLNTWFAQLGIRTISPRTGAVMVTRQTYPCQQLTNIINLIKEMEPELTQQVQVDGDLQCAVELHLKQLEEQLNKNKNKVSEYELQYQKVKNELVSAAEDLQARLTYYEQMLSLKNSQLEQLKKDLSFAQEIINKFKLTDPTSEAKYISSSDVLLSQVSGPVEFDISQQYDISYSAILNALKENSQLKIIKSGVYKPVQNFSGHPMWCDKIISLKNRRSFLTASQHPVIKQWSALTWQEERKFIGHEMPPAYNSRGGQVYDLALSPDGTRFASASGDGTAITWNLDTGAREHEFKRYHTRDICSICYLDEKTLATGSRDRTIIIWDIPSKTPVKTLTGHTSDVYGLVYLKKYNQLVSVSGDAELKAWDVDSGSCIRTLKDHDALIYALIKSPTEDYVISGSDDHTIRVWDTKNWTHKVLSGHKHFVNTLTMLDNVTLVSGSEDETIKIWNIFIGSCLATYQATGKIWGIAALNNQDIVCGDTHGILSVYRKHTYNLSFKPWLKENCTLTQSTDQAEQVKLKIADNKVDDEKEKEKNLLEREKHLIDCIEFIKDVVKCTPRIKQQNNEITIICDNNNQRQSVYDLLKSCQGTIEKTLSNTRTNASGSLSVASSSTQSSASPTFLAKLVQIKIIQQDKQVCKVGIAYSQRLYNGRFYLIGINMIYAFIYGIILAFGLIIPLGVQNIFVFNQGANQRHFFHAMPSVLTASLCDTILIVLAVLGVSIVVLTVAWLKTILFIVGFFFLMYMGWVTWHSKPAVSEEGSIPISSKRQIAFAASVSLLNPHALLDTIGVIGTSSLQFSGNAKLAFTIACILVSCFWFFGLSVSGHFLHKLDKTGLWLRLVNKLSALIIWAVAFYLVGNLLM